MKKKFLCIFCLVMFFLWSSFSLEAKGEEYETIRYLGGIKDHEFHIKPFTDMNKATEHKVYMMPLRETMETLGYKVEWHRSGKILMNKGFLRASLEVGKDNYTNRYDQKVSLYQVPIYVDGVTYVPHHFFNHVLGYDCFAVKDTFYLRTKIENILSKTYEATEVDLVGKVVEVIYPYLTSKEEKYVRVNQWVHSKVASLVNDLAYDELHLKYDIGVYNKHVLSIIFTGELVRDGESYSIFDSMNYNFKSNSEFTPRDMFRRGSNYESYILKALLRGEDEDATVSFDRLKAYFVNDAVVFYYHNYKATRPMISHFFKLDEISDMMKDEYGVFD